MAAFAPNNSIEQFIAAPIPLYDPFQQNDSDCVGVYNIVKPGILKFFYMLNHPEIPSHRASILGYMLMFHTYYGNAFMQRAEALDLIPPDPTQGYLQYSWLTTWFDMLFGDAVRAQADGTPDRSLSIVVQGGEALNFYTMYKYENIPTHDADTRVLAGNEFTYLRFIQDVPYATRQLMHKYRFFLAFGLCLHLRFFLTQLQQNQNNFQNYISRFLPRWQGTAQFKFKAYVNNYDMYDIINNPQGAYSSANDDTGNEFISRLMAIYAFIQLDPTDIIECPIVDIMIPTKHALVDSRTRIGQSDRIHSYFATPQARSTMDPPAAVNPAGRIPSQNFMMQIDPAFPMYSGQQIELRIIPLGFSIFETLRMLFVSKELQNLNTQNKMRKYRQKLNALLSSLMRSDVTQQTFQTFNIPAHKSTDPSVQNILIGGAEVSLEEIEEKELALSKQEALSKEEIKEARKFSLALKSKKERINPDEFDRIQTAGYMDFLSYQDSNFKDYRLPLLQEEKEVIKKELKKEKTKVFDSGLFALLSKPEGLTDQAIEAYTKSKAKKKSIPTTRKNNVKKKPNGQTRRTPRSIGKIEAAPVA